jgi:anti-anti-sigma factor
VQAASEPAAAIAVNCSGQLSVLRLSGAMDIASAAELRAALLKVLEAGKPIHVSVDAVTDADVTALQLLWAARRQAAKLDLAFTISGGPSQAVGSVATELGMDEAGLSA